MGRLHRLVQAARHDRVRAEIAGGAVVNEEFENLTPLEEAIHNNDVMMVRILIEAGADVNHGHPRTGKRPLHDAVTKDLRIMDLLLAAGADVEGCKETDTPLCTAAMFGKKDAYDRLLAAGANPHATRKGKPASELLTSNLFAEKQIRERFELELQKPKLDQHVDVIKKMMAEYPTVEEFAAHRGRGIYIYGFDQGLYSDPEVEQWTKRLGEILRSPKLLHELEEQYLEPELLKAANRERRSTDRYLARIKARDERIAKGNEEVSPSSKKHFQTSHLEDE